MRISWNLRIWLVIFLGALVPSSHAAKDRPNVVFILVDDMGWADMGALGHPYLHTPNLDRLMAQGTSFQQFYSASSVCSPSRAAFISGQFPARLGIHGHLSSHENNVARGMPDWVAPQKALLPQIFRDAGYRTGHFGKWHLGPESKVRVDGRPVPADYGWDVFRGRDSFGMSETDDGNKALPYDPYYRAKSTGLYVKAALDFIRADPSAPFFVNLWTLVPHAHLKPTPQERGVYRDVQPDWARFSPQMQDYAARAKDPDEQFRTYGASLTGMDEALGHLFDELEAMGLAENTLIIFASDNGPEDKAIVNASDAGMGYAGAHRARKRSIYEGGVKVPLFVVWPGRVPAGRVDRTSVLSAVDFVPTLAAIIDPAEADHWRQGDGEDVSGAWLGGIHQRKRPLLWEWRFKVSGASINDAPRLAIREGDWKYLCDPDMSREELYQLSEDPGESRDLAVGHPDVVARLRAPLLEWHREILALDP